MKRRIGYLLIAALTAGAANAATIGLQWAAAPNQQIWVPGTVNVIMTTNPSDDIATIVWNFGDASNITANNYQALMPGWNAGTAEGPLEPGTVFAVASPDAQLNINDGFDGVVATFDLSINDGPFDATEKDITFDVAANAVGVGNGLGQKLIWDARYSAAYSGYIAYGGFGNPGWGTKTSMGHQPNSNPLIIVKSSQPPEPSSFALIALGGFALLRRGALGRIQSKHAITQSQ